jgi:hypothetical protein
LFATEHTIADPSVRHEFLRWKSAWQDLPEHPQVSQKYSQAFRPQNTLERRLLGMFHHLYRVANEGLLKRWLLVFLKLSQYADEKVLRRQALSETEILFSTLDWEFWQQHLVLGKTKHTFSSQLVGKDCQIIIWANSVLPFFMAYARHEN